MPPWLGCLNYETKCGKETKGYFAEYVLKKDELQKKSLGYDDMIFQKLSNSQIEQSWT
jgi:hypothetical protein